MKRRSFLLSASASTAVFPALSWSGADTSISGAASRIGRQILAGCHESDINRLQELASALSGVEFSEICRRTALDHCEGRTIKIGGVVLSLTEASWCLSATETSS